MKRILVIGIFASAARVMSAQNKIPSFSGTRVVTASPQRALLDQYCVTCHNERQKTAGLALDKFDLAKIGENAEV